MAELSDDESDLNETLSRLELNSGTAKYFTDDTTSSEQPEDNGSFVRQEPVPKRVSDSSSSGNDDDNRLDNFLKTLREKVEKPERRESEERKRDLEFVVSDSEVEYVTDASDSTSGSNATEEETSASSSSDSGNQCGHEIQTKDCDAWLLRSLSPKRNGGSHPDAKRWASKSFSSVREEMTHELFELFNRRCFKSQLTGVNIVWTKKLQKTAGRCRRRRNAPSTIELSVHVLTDSARLRDTLVHEMCHAAVQMIDQQRDRSHGALWTAWTRRCIRAFPVLKAIDVKHRYKINYKYVYTCTSDGCPVQIKRQSKSVDIERMVCGKCHGKLVLTVHLKGGKTRTVRRRSAANENAEETGNMSTKNNDDVESRKPTAFAVLVKEEYRNYKRAGVSHKHVMSQLAALHRFRKTHGSTAELPEELRPPPADLSPLRVALQIPSTKARLEIQFDTSTTYKRQVILENRSSQRLAVKWRQSDLSFTFTPVYSIVEIGQSSSVTISREGKEFPEGAVRFYVVYYPMQDGETDPKTTLTAAGREKEHWVQIVPIKHNNT